MLFSHISSPWTLVVAGLACIDAVAAQDKYPITGVFTGVDATTGYRPPRRDIRDLQLDKPSFSLYVQAMNKMMATTETNLTSYFQIAGIHGRPFISWDNVNPATPADGIPIGYCTHGNILFGTWHRPYLALVEQVMATHAQEIAKTYNSATYTKAADNLRLPYFDWAAAPQQFPAIMSAPNVDIDTPTGPKSVKNPLYRFDFLSVPYPEEWFPTTPGSYDGFFALQPFTLRQPNANNQSRDNLIPPQFAEEGPILTAQIWNVFAKTSDFNTMTTNGNSPGPDFESPHGSIHGMIGGTNGHMSPVSFAGFDPVFWLHHATVDRQVAMWQAIYPDSWMTPARSPGGTWTIYPNTIVDEFTPLTPFTTADKKTPWTSRAARYTKAFGYSYPDVQDWLFTPAQLSANVTARVNQLYNPDGILTKRSLRVRGSLAARDELREWSVAVAASNNAIGEPFSVVLSVGDVLVGKMVVLAAPSKVELDAGAKKVTHAEYSLGKGLDGVPSDVKSVAAFLKENLKWGVVRSIDDTTVPLEQVEGLEVVVQDELVTPAEDNSKFPVYGKKTPHPDITA